ncbi:MAG: SH3 domain-containing protein [Chloroflexota bacterium]
MMPNRRTVIKAHQRSYDDPIALEMGEIVEITKQELWDDQYLWLWCVAANGKSGWVPESILTIEGARGSAQRAYNALELTVEPGALLIVHEWIGGWYWVENGQGECGWIPDFCLAEQT